MGTPFAALTPHQSPPTRVRYIVLAGLCAVTLIAYVHRNSIAVAEKEIRADLGLTPEQMAWVMSAFFAAYAVAQIPTGWLGHIWGTRRALSLFALLDALAAGLFGLAGNLPTLLAARLGMGTAQAGMLPCATNSVSKWFPA